MILNLSPTAMTALLCRLVFLLATTVPLGSAAAGWTPETLPMVHLEDARRYVCNPDGVLSSTAVSRTDSLLMHLERDKGVEAVVVVVNHIEGDDPYAFGMALSRKYGIGSKTQNSGLIVILAVADRSYQILTGSGLEATLPDAICRRLQNRIMVPALKRGDWNGAIVNTIIALDRYIRNDDELTADADSGSGLNDRIIGLILAAAVLVFIMCIYFFTQRRRCPQCGKRTMRITDSRRIRTGTGYKVRRKWRCSSCGYTETTDHDDRSGGLHAGPWLPPFILGGGRGLGLGRGTGGFGGGSFGGGSFGGGGSGGRF